MVDIPVCETVDIPVCETVDIPVCETVDIPVCEMVDIPVCEYHVHGVVIGLKSPVWSTHMDWMIVFMYISCVN